MNLERHQVQHVVNRLLIGDNPATFRYHGIAFTVERLVNGYDVTAYHDTRQIRSRSLHKNMTEQVVGVIDEIANVRRCLICNVVLTPNNWKVSRKAGLKVYIRSYCCECYKARDVAAALKWRTANRVRVTNRQRERRQEKRTA